MRSDYKKFANEGFLRTIDAALLHRFLTRHAIAAEHLDPGLLLTDAEVGRAAVAAFLLGPRDRCPESLTSDLHRIAQLARPIGLDILQEEARRRAVVLVSEEDRPTATPRNVALRTFIEHPEIFQAAESALDFIQPATVAEFIAPEEGITAELGQDSLTAIEGSAREIFQADLRGEFCQVVPHDEEDEMHVSIRHGAPLETREVLGQDGRQVVSFREIQKVVLAYSALQGRLKAWGGTKTHRTALAEAFARIALDRPKLFKAAAAQRLYTLEPAERAGGAFEFRHAHDDGIESVRIYEAQVNRTAVNPRSGTERTLFSLIVRDGGGQALRLLHTGRPDIAYGQGWKLDHLTLKVMLRTDGPRPVALTVKVKPEATVSFQRHRHEQRVMRLLRLNGMVHGRASHSTALAAE
jgi:hypothetical protein